DLPSRGVTRIGMVVADGERHDTLAGMQVRVREGSTIAYTITRPAVARIVVTDAATSRPVEGARVYQAAWRSWQHFEKDGFSMPGPDEVKGAPVLTDAEGCASLRKTRDGPGEMPGVLVVSPRHAWERGTLTSDKAERLEVSLKPGGSLRIHVANWASLL